MKEMPLGEVKARISEVVEMVHATHERVVITRHGHPDVVLISMDDLVSMEETIELMSDPIAMKEISEARAEIARGAGMKEAEIRKRYLGGKP